MGGLKVPVDAALSERDRFYPYHFGTKRQRWSHVKYPDFNCPFCREIHLTLEPSAQPKDPA